MSQVVWRKKLEEIDAKEKAKLGEEQPSEEIKEESDK